MASLFSPQAPQLVPIPAPSQVLTPSQQAQGTKPTRQNMTPSFIGSAAMPQGQANAGGKTLIGQ